MSGKKGKRKQALEKQPNKQEAPQKQRETAAPDGKYKKLLWPAVTCAAILLITWVCLKPSLECGLTNWDDTAYVIENTLLRGDLSSEHIKAIWNTPISLNYHPITIYSYVLDFQKGELDPEPYHRTNLMFHLFNTLLVFIFVFLLSGKKLEIAIITSLFFGIHPMHVESVTWVSERKDVLYTFFFLLSFIAYFFYVKSTSKLKTGLFYVLSLGLFVLSIWSKAMAVVLPITMLLADFMLKRKLDVKLILEKLPFLGLSVYYGLMAVQVQSEGAIAEFELYTFWQRIQFASYGAMMYIVKLFAPLKLSAFYPYPGGDGLGELPIIYPLSPFIILALLGLTAWSLKKTRVVFFGVGFYFVTVALVLQFVSVGRAIMADRYTYLPYIGLLYVIGYGVWYLREKSNLKTVQYASYGILGVAMVAFFQITNARTLVWKDSETLWTDVIEKYPIVDVAYKNRGNYYGQNGKPNEALEDYQKFININPKDATIFVNVGNAYNIIGEQTGKQNEYARKSITYYQKAVELDDKNFRAYHNRANAYGALQEFEKAFADYEKAAEIEPNNPKIWFNMAITQLKGGKFEEAIKGYTKVVQYNPGEVLAWIDLGTCKYNLGRFQEAIADFQTASNLEPNNPKPLFNISVSYYQMKNYSKALEYATKAQSLGYQVPGNYLTELRQKAG